MPIYEYVCSTCRNRFSKLQPMSFSGQVSCPDCGSPSKRALSLFAAVSKGTDGQTAPVTGGGCASCSGGSCATCGH